MEEGLRNYIIVFEAVTFLLILIIFFSVYEPEEVFTNDLKECNLLGSQKQGAIDLLFFSDKKNAEKYGEYLLQTPPFSKNKDFFNFYYIDKSTYSPNCELYKGIALFCHSKELEKVAASCPHDFIAVINEQEGNAIRSSAYLGVMSINAEHPLSVLIHEFGHVFTNLAEEYDADIPPAKGSENCAKECAKFGDEVDGCYLECSDSEHYRSINSGVMRTLISSDYGIFNSGLIQRTIDEKASEKLQEGRITGLVIEETEECRDEKYILAEILIEDKNVKILDVSLGQGCAPIITGINKELYYQASVNEEEAFTGEIGTTLWTDYHSNGNTGGETYANYEGVSYISVPDSNADKLRILDKETGEVLAESKLKVNRPCRI